METVPIETLDERIADLARRVEGKPILDLVPHKRRGGLDLEGLAAFKKKHGIDRFVTHIPDDFDDPLPEDFLITPLPEPSK